MNKFRVIFFLLFAVSSKSFAADETWTHEFLGDLASPVTTHAYLPLAIGSGVTALAYGFKYEVGDPLQRSWQLHKPLGSASKYGDDLGQMLPNAIYALGMGIHYWSTDDKKSRERAILMVKASLYAGGVSAALKYAFREPRPNGSNDMASFPSGHATTAFAFAAMVGAEHEWYWAAPSYLMATFVAASRINDNMHRLHDVIGGATIGMSYALGVWYRAHPDIDSASGGHERERSKVQFQVLPAERLDGAIVTGLYEF
jgi:hypothetical protein